MKLERHVKLMPDWGIVVPSARKIAGQAVFPFILLRRDIYEDLQTAKPNQLSRAILIHEQTHIDRARAMNPIAWGAMYLLNPEFRIAEEIAADREAMKFWKSQGLEYDFDRRATFLSQWYYLWAISKEEAKIKLIEAWESI